jgi:ATP-dependent RNA helicase RhlE
VNRQDKSAVLADLLRAEPIDRVLVFTRTKHGADKLVRGLGKAGIGAEAIHGNKSQGQRERVLAAFRQGDVRILVATDIAARGIDVEGVSHVVNYDLPNEPESYVHRIGRTARAGASGTAISLCDADEMPYLRSIEKLIRMSLPATSRRGDPARTAAAAASAAGQGRGRSRPARQRSGAPLAPDTEGKRPARAANSPTAKSITANSPSAKTTANGGRDTRPPGPSAKTTANGGRDTRPPGYGAGHARRSTAAQSAVARDLSRVAFLNRGIEPRRDSVPHRQSTGVRKHGEGRAD